MARTLRSQGAFRRHWDGTATGLLGLLAGEVCSRNLPNTRRPDLDPCLHRLVELPDRTRPEQHHGFRAMTSTSWFQRFAFAYGPAFAILYVIALKLDLALFTVYPTIGVVLLGTHHSRDTVGPSMGSLLPAMRWYGWTTTAALGALIFSLVAASLPDRWTHRVWSGGLWMVPVAAMIASVYVTLPWFRL